MGIVVGSKLKKNELLEVAGVHNLAFGTGLGLLLIFGSFIGFAICLMACKNRCFAIIVSR